MARLLTTQRVAPGGERLEHVSVTDRGLDDLDAGLAHRQVEPEVGHHGDHHRVVTKQSAAVQIGRADRQDVVAVDHVAELVDSDQTVGITIEGDPDVCPLGAHHGLQPGRIGGAAAIVDVGAVRLGVDHHDLRPAALKDLGDEVRGSPVGGIDDHPQTRRACGPRAPPGDGWRTRRWPRHDRGSVPARPWPPRACAAPLRSATRPRRAAWCLPERTA